jgi:hypothetical protein
MNLCAKEAEQYVYMFTYSISTACADCVSFFYDIAGKVNIHVPEYKEAADHLILNSSSALGLVSSNCDVKDAGAIPAS